MNVLFIALWVVFIGPLWLVGWAVLHSTKTLNRVAALWCRFCFMLFPKE